MRKLATASYESSDRTFLCHEDLPDDLIADFFPEVPGISLAEVRDMSVLSQVPDLLNQVQRIVALRVGPGSSADQAQDIALIVFSGLDAIDCFTSVRSHMAVLHVETLFRKLLATLSARMSPEIDDTEQAFLDALHPIFRHLKAA